MHQIQCHQFAKMNTERFTHHLHVVGSRCKCISCQLTFWKYEHFHEFESLRQSGFLNDLYKNSFCSCFMNEAHCVVLSKNSHLDLDLVSTHLRLFPWFKSLCQTTWGSSLLRCHPLIWPRLLPTVTAALHSSLSFLRDQIPWQHCSSLVRNRYGQLRTLNLCRCLGFGAFFCIRNFFKGVGDCFFLVLIVFMGCSLTFVNAFFF